ncbi:MAG: DUF2179 domain-containing protein [bacterium]|nr:DUF2179 domain-containing protein [bacterium]
MWWDSSLFNWVILPLLIFMARVIDVSLGTIRIIFLTHGRRKLTSVLSFIEILVWLMAIRQIFSNLNNPLCYLAYAGGFATGSYIGMFIEHKLALGLRVIRIITHFEATGLIRSLREEGYGVTVIDGMGNTGLVKVIFTVIKRVNIPKVTGMIERFNPKAFYSIEDVRTASEGVFPNQSTTFLKFIKFGGLKR